jgi:putative membrane protein
MDLRSQRMLRAGLVSLAVILTSALGQEGPGESGAKKEAPKNPDAAFVLTAAEATSVESGLAEIAKDRAKSEALRNFAQQAFAGHAKAFQELETLAASKNITLPADFSAERKAMAGEMLKHDGADFDKAYLKRVVIDNQTALGIFQQEAVAGADPDVKTWAQKMVRQWQDHFKTAQELAEKIGKS